MSNEKTMIFRNGSTLDLEEAEREKRIVSTNFMDTIHKEVESWQEPITSVKLAVNGAKDFPISDVLGKKMELLYYSKKNDPNQYSMVFEWVEPYMARPTTVVKHVYKDPVLGVVFMITASGSCYINITHDIWGRKNPDVWLGTVRSDTSLEINTQTTFHCFGKGSNPFQVTYQRSYKIEGIVEDKIILPGQTQPSIIMLNSNICFMI